MKRARTIGILYPGEMGSTIARELRSKGHRVVTTTRGRSVQTARRARESGIEILPSLEAVAREADIVISLVPPKAALSTARAFSRAAQRARKRPLYTDANAVSPMTAEKIASTLDLDFVDAAIHGLASRFRTDGVLYLSGKRSGEVAKLFEGLIRIRRLGGGIGRASALKMLTGGLNKGLVALYFELLWAAEKAGLRDEMQEAYRRQYPGVMKVVDRLVPSYSRHAGRRRDELHELERALTAWGTRPEVVRGARRVIAKLSE